jgi:hypothetical protein
VPNGRHGDGAAGSGGFCRTAASGCVFYNRKCVSRCRLSEHDEELRRVRFYGTQDLATGWYVPRVLELAEQFDPLNAPTNTTDVLELHHVQMYLEHGLLPTSLTDNERVELVARVPQIRSAVARHFSAVHNNNFASIVAGVGHAYHADLLDLLGRSGAYERCDGEAVLGAFAAAGIHLREMLACKKLVRAYDGEIREQLLASPRNAEHLIRKYLEDDVRDEVHLPPGFTTSDSRGLLERYIDSESANPNYLGLVATAQEVPHTGIDAKLKLRAKRRNDELTIQFFKQNQGIKTGCTVAISDQEEPVLFELEDTHEELVIRYTYSRQWLEHTCDNASILNNFIHLFDFADHQALLTLPSYPAQLGVMERFMRTTGRTEYKVGASFRSVDMSTLLQTRMYHHFLESNDIDLERVLSWFFSSYLVEEFEVAHFSFTPSTSGTPYLQKVRHLFAEMESVANQFMLFVREGTLDRDLLTMQSELVRYRQLPSLLDGKYVCQAESDEVAGVLHLLFSDQSTLTYIGEGLREDSAAKLILRNEVAYTDFANHQQSSVDHLIRLGVLGDTGTRVQFVNIEIFFILHSLFTTQAANYYYLSDVGRAEADALVARGWATRSSTLLTEAEAKYYNYFLNGVDFTNGPGLRNKYLHGSQANADGEDAHFHTYMTALRLTVALVIKMNDDLCLWSSELDRRRDADHRQLDGRSPGPSRE